MSDRLYRLRFGPPGPRSSKGKIVMISLHRCNRNLNSAPGYITPKDIRPIAHASAEVSTSCLPVTRPGPSGLREHVALVEIKRAPRQLGSGTEIAPSIPPLVFVPDRLGRFWKNLRKRNLTLQSLAARAKPNSFFPVCCSHCRRIQSSTRSRTSTRLISLRISCRPPV